MRTKTRILFTIAVMISSAGNGAAQRLQIPAESVD